MGISGQRLSVRSFFKYFLMIVKPIVYFRFLNSLMIMKDGHFGLQRFSKVDDPDNVSLLAGMGLFPPDCHYNEYILNVVAYSEEVCIQMFVSQLELGQRQSRSQLAQNLAPLKCKTRSSSKALLSQVFWQSSV